MNKNILEITRLISDEEAQKVVEKFKNKPDVIKGKSFDDLLDNIDKWNTNKEEGEAVG